METKESVRVKVIEHLVQASDAKVAADQVTDQTRLRQDLAMDSLQAVCLALDLEEVFGITVETDELESFQTVGDVLAMIEQKMSAQRSV